MAAGARRARPPTFEGACTAASVAATADVACALTLLCHIILPPLHRGRTSLLQIPCAPEFDWGTEPRPHLASDQLVIYEMHVRGFTAHHTSGVRHPGAPRLGACACGGRRTIVADLPLPRALTGLFLGVVERAQHLQRMGVTAIELLPVHAFNEMEWASRRNPITGEVGPPPLRCSRARNLTRARVQALKQYWGYSTVNFFAPMPCYATMPLRAAHEFKTMVKVLPPPRTAARRCLMRGGRRRCTRWAWR